MFTDNGKETRKISKLFKDTQIKTANTIQNIVNQHPQKANTMTAVSTK
jgi:hypothetical protein